MKKDQNENTANYLKRTKLMPLPNIHLKKGKYPQSGKELINFSTIPDMPH